MINTKELLQKIESGDVSYEDKLAALGQVETALKEMRERKEAVLNDRVGVIIDALKTMQAKVAAQLEEAKAIVPDVGPAGPKGEAGDRGLDGSNGHDGRDGVDGRNGVDGVDGISVTDANIDFDGSLIITLSSGRVINVGEVVAPDLAEKIKVITNGGGTSQGVLDAIAAIEAVIATYGTMALQNANAVAITGGNINNTVIGDTTPNAATFTTLTATGQTSLGGVTDSESMRVLSPAATGTYIQVQSSSSVFAEFRAIGSQTNNSLRYVTRGGGNHVFATNNSGSTVQLQVSPTVSAVNYVQVTGAATGGGLTTTPRITSQGSDANIALQLEGKGNGEIRLASHRTNYLAVSGSGSAGGLVTFTATGGDTNIDLALTPKGTGLVRFGTRTASADAAITGYIEIKDSAGTTRRLAVIG